MKLTYILLIIICSTVNNSIAGQFSPNGNLYAELTTNLLIVWNIETGDTIHTLDITKKYLVNKLDDEVDLTKDYKIKTLSNNGRFIVLTGWEDFYIQDKWRYARATAYFDLEKNTQRAYIEEKRWAHKEIIIASPEENDYVFSDVVKNQGKFYTVIYCKSFDSNDRTSIQINADPKEKGYDNVLGYGRIVNRDGIYYYALSYEKGTKLYNLSNLEESKPLKLKVKKSDLYGLCNQNLTIVYNTKKERLLENGKPMKTASNFELKPYKYTSFFVEGSTLIAQWEPDDKEIRLFNYETNSYSPSKKLYTEDHEWILFSTNGKYAVVQFKTEKKVYNLVTGEITAVLKGHSKH